MRKLICGAYPRSEITPSYYFNLKGFQSVHLSDLVNSQHASELGKENKCLRRRKKKKRQNSDLLLHVIILSFKGRRKAGADAPAVAVKLCSSIGGAGLGRGSRELVHCQRTSLEEDTDSCESPVLSIRSEWIQKCLIPPKIQVKTKPQRHQNGVTSWG